jgi:hypothetical protein
MLTAKKRTTTIIIPDVYSSDEELPPPKKANCTKPTNNLSNEENNYDGVSFQFEYPTTAKGGSSTAQSLSPSITTKGVLSTANSGSSTTAKKSLSPSTETKGGSSTSLSKVHKLTPKVNDITPLKKTQSKPSSSATNHETSSSKVVTGNQTLWTVTIEHLSHFLHFMSALEKVFPEAVVLLFNFEAKRIEIIQNKEMGVLLTAIFPLDIINHPTESATELVQVVLNTAVVVKELKNVDPASPLTMTNCENYMRLTVPTGKTSQEILIDKIHLESWTLQQPKLPMEEYHWKFLATATELKRLFAMGASDVKSECVQFEWFSNERWQAFVCSSPKEQSSGGYGVKKTFFQRHSLGANQNSGERWTIDSTQKDFDDDDELSPELDSLEKQFSVCFSRKWLTEIIQPLSDRVPSISMRFADGLPCQLNVMMTDTVSLEWFVVPRIKM